MFRNPLVDIFVVLLVILLFFGPKRLPELGRSLGSGIREFKDGIGGGSDAKEEEPGELTSKSSSGDSGHSD
jgi:TatA/E family protein of Tat protein translocase